MNRSSILLKNREAYVVHGEARKYYSIRVRHTKGSRELWRGGDMTAYENAKNVRKKCSSTKTMQE